MKPLPCPFCGGREFTVDSDYKARRVVLCVECTGCHARGPLVGVLYKDDGEKGDALAHDRWNARKQRRAT